MSLSTPRRRYTEQSEMMQTTNHNDEHGGSSMSSRLRRQSSGMFYTPVSRQSRNSFAARNNHDHEAILAEANRSLQAEKGKSSGDSNADELTRKNNASTSPMANQNCSQRMRVLVLTVLRIYKVVLVEEAFLFFLSFV